MIDKRVTIIPKRAHLFILACLMCLTTVQISGQDKIESMEVFFEPPVGIIVTDVDQAFLEGQAMDHIVVLKLLSTMDVQSIDIELGTQSEVHDLVDRTFEMDGSDLPQGFELRIEGDHLYLDVGVFPLHQPLYGSAHFIHSDGSLSNSVTLNLN
jgi:hypothetical protein